MNVPPPPRRPIVIRASRDTLLLLAAATGLTFALAYAVHTRPAPQAATGPTREWTGQLADLAPQSDGTASVAEPLSSDALTVPKATMALPRDPRPLKARACEGPACAAKAVPPTPTRRATAELLPSMESQQKPVPVISKHEEPSLMARMNPLNQIPDAVKRPFAAAGSTVAAWVSRF